MELDKVFLKIMLLGDSMVGKTTLRARYMGLKFEQDYQMTLGVDFSTITYVVEQNGKQKEVKVQIWDVAGQMIFAKLRQKFYKGTTGFLLMFDLTREKTLFNLDKWVSEIKNFFEHDDSKLNIPIIVVGNKSDLKKSIILTRDSIDTFLIELSKKHELPLTTYYETSAKTREQIDLVLTTIVDNILESNPKK